VWDTFSRKPGAVFEGHSGEVACDHYHRYRDDVALMKTLGIRSYRFSVSWTRVLPDGVAMSIAKVFDFSTIGPRGPHGIRPPCLLGPRLRRGRPTPDVSASIAGVGSEQKPRLLAHDGPRSGGLLVPH